MLRKVPTYIYHAYSTVALRCRHNVIDQPACSVGRAADGGRDSGYGYSYEVYFDGVAVQVAEDALTAPDESQSDAEPPTVPEE